MNCKYYIKLGKHTHFTCSCFRYDQNGQKQHEETEETHLQQQIELIETIKHQVIGNHDNPAVADSTPSVPDQPLYTLPHLTHQLIEEQQLQPQYHRTCRQEACYYPNDITVDELAGYLDELLYLPQPMSDMAELMYT